MTGALPTHYARALADAVFAPESGIAPAEAVTQFQTVRQLLSGSKDLRLALDSPAVNRTRKVAVLSKLAEELGLHRIMRNFLLVVVTHRRTKKLAAIEEQFEGIVDERLGWVRAEIASAQELGPEEKEQVERALGTALGKFIRANYTMDPSLLAGIRAQVESKEYDASLRGKLESMRRRLQQAV